MGIAENLVRRSQTIKAIRRFFDERGFVEVETPVRIAAPAPEPHIDCPEVIGWRGSENSFLRASPELQMKKLLALGMENIYQIGPCFREGECGSRHSGEFTMLEWYRRGRSYLDIKRDMEELVRSLMGGEVAIRDITVREAYRSFAGWDPWTDWDQDRFDFDMAVKVEPEIRRLGGGVFLMDYPVEAASLAKLGDGSAERWEFYWNGLELANAFTELCDSAEQRRRFEIARDERRELGEADYPLDEEFLGVLDCVGSASGVAVGVDRLVMAVCGIDHIALSRFGDFTQNMI
jgi:lysyl-tRNA synthetase class 2